MAKRAEWLTRIAAWRASGKSAREFCQSREYSAQSLQWWSWHVGRGTAPAASKVAPPVALARAVRKPVPAQSSVSAIVVHIGAARIEVGSTDRRALAAVLDAVLALPTGGRR